LKIRDRFITMAYIIPSLDQIRHSNANDGELQVAETLQEKLPQDVFAWFNPSIPPQNLEPDFLVLDPGRGLLVIEVKDWHIDTIQEANDDCVTLLVNGKRKNTTNPLKQCKQYGFAVKNQIEDLSVLLNHSGRYEGNPIFSYGLIIVLTNITRAELKAKGWDNVLGSKSVFCKDEIFDDSDSEVFAEKLWSTLHFTLRNRLNQSQIDRFVQQLGLTAVRNEFEIEDSPANNFDKPDVITQKSKLEAPAKPEPKLRELPKPKNNKDKVILANKNPLPVAENPPVEQNPEKTDADEYLPEDSKQPVDRDVESERAVNGAFVTSQETDPVKLLNGRYQIESILSEGGFAKTFIAKDQNRPSHPICVVKKLKNQNSDVVISQRVKQLFENEAKVLEELGNHAQIPRLLAHFEEDNHLYIVQEYIEGITLAEEIFNNKPIPEARVTNIVKELLEILNFVHSHNVIHRDISPNNIIIRKQDDRLVLIDFGAVKEVIVQGQTSHTLIGTPGYIAPEQQCGKPKFCSDLYSVGIIAIEALTGLNANEIIENREHSWSNQSSISDRLSKILLKMISFQAERRYQSAQEAIADFAKVDAPIPAVKEDEQPPGGNKWLFWTIGASVVASFLFIGANFLQPALTGTKPVYESFESALDEGDICRGSLENLMGNTFCEKYTFEAKSGQQVIIKMNSEQFDPYLILQSPDGEKLKVNGDITPDNWNSEIVVNLPIDGSYTALAKTSSVGESGKYSLEIDLK
jgi:serine/threonine protein kinase